jgi:hypothetical protein
MEKAYSIHTLGYVPDISILGRGYVPPKKKLGKLD